MNVSDSELVETLLIKQGYQKVDHPDKADILFVNTCSIREHAEDKVHSLLGRYNLLKRNKPIHDHWSFRLYGSKFKR